jgi:hypothetical protein
VLLFAGLVADQRVEKLDLPYDRALALLSNARSEDAVVIDAFDYFPMRHYAPHAHWSVYAENGRLEYFLGGPIVMPDDHIANKQEVEALSRTTWIVENSDKASVAVPTTLRVRHRSVFGLLIVTEYEPRGE